MKRTRIILISMLVVAGIEAYSNPVDEETAKRVAQNFMGRSRSASKTVSDVVVEQFDGYNSIYVVNFREGGWVMVSAENSTVPVLAFSIDDTYRTEDEKPDGMLYLMDDYKEQINISRKTGTTRSNEIIEMWTQLLDEDNSSNRSRQVAPLNTRTYISGRNLLTDPARGGEIAWGQSRNNSGDCYPYPTYNSEIKKKWNHGWFSPCNCDAPPVGCGAVAMGQLMWYWKWPQRSTYRTYNWDLMPNELINTTPTAEANEIAQLLLDCGEASNMKYACAGSFTLNLESALKYTFGYGAARKAQRSSLSSAAWNDLIRSEIDSERPVIMYGARALTISKRHYFIVDGYCDPLHPVHTGHSNHFHINFGWTGSYSGPNDYYYLNNINPGGDYYSDNNYALVDIFPNPTLTGPAEVCYSGSTFTLSSMPLTLSTVTWSVTGPFTVSGNGTTATVTRTADTSNSSGMLTASMNGGVIASKVITPCPASTIDGYTEICPSGCFTLLNPPPGTIYWTLSYTGDFIVSSSGNPTWVTYVGTGSPLNTLHARIGSASGPVVASTVVVPCTLHLAPPLIAVYPNPTSDILNIEIDGEAITNAQNSEQSGASVKRISIESAFNIRLYDGQGNLLRHATAKEGNVQFNVANLPNGIYYLHFYKETGNKPEIQQIVVEH